MRALLVIAVVILLMALAGWVRFYSSTDEAGVEFKTQEMREDVEQVGDTLQRSVEDVRNRPDEEVSPAESNPPADLDPSTSEPPPQDPIPSRMEERNELENAPR